MWSSDGEPGPSASHLEHSCFPSIKTEQVAAGPILKRSATSAIVSDANIDVVLISGSMVWTLTGEDIQALQECRGRYQVTMPVRAQCIECSRST